MQPRINRLQGPRGTFRSGEKIVRSQFERFARDGRTGWQWAAFGEPTAELPCGVVLHVVEMPDVLADVCDTPTGALWVLRECAAHYLHDVRSHRGH
ncbi:hypothetical protein [Burkholderia plantarii]|uniref:hypothetical protein n=1 Tax=Burkholderia plantarii TaxID=41899 RepID=UPI0008709658|nr:hypothetical protein [Burkholderia plantarii]